MVKIDTVTAYGTISHIKKKDKPRAKSSFNVAGKADGGATNSAAASKSAAEIASLAQLMQIQEVGSRESNEKQAARGGEEILASLEKLQNEILMGGISKRSLDHIVSTANRLPMQISDPNLRQIVAEIKQRAMIEIAKIEMAS